MIGTPFGHEYSNWAVEKFELDIAARFIGNMPEIYQRYIDIVDVQPPCQE